MMRAWPWGTLAQKEEISQAQALRIGYLKSMSSAILTWGPGWGGARGGPGEGVGRGGGRGGAGRGMVGRGAAIEHAAFVLG
jgi:hypothetical protein